MKRAPSPSKTKPSKDGFVRWSYLLPRAVILGALAAFFLFAFDGLLKKAVVLGGSRALGAKLDVAVLKTAFFPPTLELEGVAAADPADPMRNLLEFKELSLALDGDALLKKRLLIPKGALSGLQWGTTRKTSGALAKASPSAARRRLGRMSDRGKDALGALSKKTAVQKYKVRESDLASLQLASDIETSWTNRFGDWDRQLKDFATEADAAGIQGRIQRIAKEPNPLHKVKKAKALAVDLDQMKTAVRKMKTEFTGELMRAREDLASLEKAKQKDLSALEERLQLPDFSTDRMTAFFLGDKIAGPIGTVLDAVAKARSLLPPKGPKPRRQALRGIHTEFPRGHSLPDWWLRSLRLDGSHAGLELKGTASDLASVPSQIPNPAEVRLDGKGRGAKLLFRATLDHRSERPVDRFRFEYEGLSVAPFSAGSSETLALDFSEGRGTLRADLILRGNNLDGLARFTVSGASIRTRSGDSGDEVSSALARSLRGLKELDLEVELSGTLNSPRWKLRSNLGRAAASGLSGVLGKNVTRMKSDLRTQVDSLVGPRQKDLKGALGKTESTLRNRLNLGEKRIDGFKKEIEKAAKPSLPGGLKLPKLGL